jgi:hypothetical protein
MDYEYPPYNLANGKHHGIGYHGDDLILFKSVDRKSIVSRKITVAQSLEWLESMAKIEIEGDHSIEGTWDEKARLRWYHDLRAAIK